LKTTCDKLAVVPGTAATQNHNTPEAPVPKSRNVKYCHFWRIAFGNTGTSLDLVAEVHTAEAADIKVRK